MAEQEESKSISFTKDLYRQKVSRMDFEILANFYTICKKKGISEREVSFLLGKKNKYFTEILNPFAKEHIKTEFVDMLPAIASSSYRHIIPNDVKSNETVDIEGSHIFYSDRTSEITYYKFTVTYDDGSSKNYRWKIKTAKGERAKVNVRLIEILQSLIDSWYFRKPKFALTLYLYLKKRYKSEFSALEIQITLAKLCNKKASPEYALEEGSKNARLTYRKILSDKDRFGLYCQDHKIWISSYIPLEQRSPLYFIWYEGADGNDKLLTYNNGKIVNSPSVEDLLELLRNYDQDFTRPDSLDSWLSNMTDLVPIESIVHSPSQILKNFQEGIIDRTVLHDFVNLFNLHGDLGHQDPMYNEILDIQDIPSLREAWDCFYDNHFWKTDKLVKFDIDRAALTEDFEKVVKKFEEFLS